MRVIYKYPLIPTTTPQRFATLGHPVIRHVGLDPQTEAPTMWIEQNTDGYSDWVDVVLVNTGDVLSFADGRLDYVASVITPAGGVHHLYQIGGRPA